MGSVAPPARMPPKFCTATQMRAKTTTASTTAPWATCGAMNTPTATSTQTTASRIAMAVPWCNMSASEARSMLANQPGWPEFIPAIRS